MYDSMCIGDLCLYGKEAVASLVRTSRKHFFLMCKNRMVVVILAFMLMISAFSCVIMCAETDPAKLVYNQTELIIISHFSVA